MVANSRRSVPPLAHRQRHLIGGEVAIAARLCARDLPDALFATVRGVKSPSDSEAHKKRAKIAKCAMKDLRDTFASQLLTCGAPLGYISNQLGHADIGVTSRHYARWCGGAEFRAPMVPAENEVPADLLARIAPEVPIKSP
jgi:integrase